MNEMTLWQQAIEAAKRGWQSRFGTFETDGNKLLFEGIEIRDSRLKKKVLKDLKKYTKGGK